MVSYICRQKSSTLHKVCIGFSSNKLLAILSFCSLCVFLFRSVIIMEERIIRSQMLKVERLVKKAITSFNSHWGKDFAKKCIFDVLY